MGQGYSGFSNNWKNQDAQKYIIFLTTLFGKPYIYVNQPMGLAIWINKNFINKTLFGNPICFQKIIVNDEIGNNFVYIFIKVPISIAQEQNLIQLSNNIGIDRSQQLLWVKSQSIDNCIVLLKLITDSLSGGNITNKTIEYTLNSIYVNNPQTNNVNISLEKKIYNSLYTNIVSLNKEFFMDQPWYAITDPYSSNKPWNIDQVEQSDDEYYKSIDNINNKNVSKSPDAYPRAPTGKPSMDNYNDIPQKKKKKEMMTVARNPACKGACAKRYNKIVNHENLIDFNAYDKFQKHLINPKQENLINFNAYDIYRKKPKSQSLANSVSEHMINLGELTGFIKKKNT